MSDPDLFIVLVIGILKERIREISLFIVAATDFSHFHLLDTILLIRNFLVTCTHLIIPKIKPIDA